MDELRTLLEQGAVKAARQLIGWRFYRVLPDGTRLGGTIIETEAYTQEDAASHTFRGETPRNSVMFGPAGHLYVYFTYGMHWCVNVVTGVAGHGEAVLIRALIPEAGLPMMRQNRGGRPDHELTNGPAKVCQALGITGQHSGQALGTECILLPPVKKFRAHATTRIGIQRDTHRLWRFIAD